jgi:hypothetical protein
MGETVLSMPHVLGTCGLVPGSGEAARPPSSLAVLRAS